MKVTTQEIKLPERGIYMLPDGREFVISKSGDGCGYLLYNLEAGRRHRLPDYGTQLNGRILSRVLSHTGARKI